MGMPLLMQQARVSIDDTAQLTMVRAALEMAILCVWQCQGMPGDLALQSGLTMPRA